jgi:hypothetical protein
MSTAKTSAAHVTAKLSSEIPDTYQAVQDRIVSIHTDYTEETSRLEVWYQSTMDLLLKKRDELQKKSDPDAYLERRLEEMRKTMEEEIRAKMEQEKHASAGTGKALSFESKRDFYAAMVKQFPGGGEVTRAQMAVALGLHKETDKGKINGLTAIFKALESEGFVKWNGKGTINSAYSVVDPKKVYVAPAAPAAAQGTLAV